MKLIIVTATITPSLVFKTILISFQGFLAMFSIETRPLPIRGEHNLIIKSFLIPNLENYLNLPGSTNQITSANDGIPDREAGGAVLLNGHIINHIGIPLSWKIFSKSNLL